MIQFRRVSRSYDGGSEWALRDVTFSVADGETVALLGSSGSGKSTLLRLVNALDRPDEGDVAVDGVPVAASDPLSLRRSIGYVLQDVGLFPHLSVLANVEVVPRLLGWSRKDRRRRAEEMLELVDLKPALFATRQPASLSGGQRQRVGIARALAARPGHLLMDEPFGALDAVVRTHLHTQLETIRSRTGTTICLVTHDPMEAIRLGDRVGVMHEGRLLQLGSWKDLRTAPADRFVESLVHHVEAQAAMVIPNLREDAGSGPRCGA
ncbi:MAG TPA: ATP-binding cassette domain-containing protein [Phycisphaerales bacterium]|nr:ATP-binding cassette domain-containing protein [Phycisphaerales bacterium]HMP36241.1 ATP-binding cassette domain-containing protein [Phycisphaerales bacterium]